MGTHTIKISNGVYNLIPNIYNTNGVKWKGVDVVVLTRSKGISIKYNNIYKRPRKYKRTN
jgi:hypothetical protein